MACLDKGLVVLDINNIRNPILINQYEINDSYLVNFYIEQDILYAIDWLTGLNILNITNLDSLNLIGSYTRLPTPTSIFVEENIAFITDLEFGLVVLDISSKLEPREIGQFNDKGNANFVLKFEDLIFVADGKDGLEIFKLISSRSKTIFLLISILPPIIGFVLVTIISTRMIMKREN